MRYYPSRRGFVELARDHDLVPVYRQLLGDTLTPVTAFCSIQESDWSFLFESVVGGEVLGRYSFLGSGPFLVLQAWDRHVRIENPCNRREVKDLRSRRSPAAARRNAGRSHRAAVCPVCRDLPAGPWAMPATTPSATSRTCRTRRRTIAACPTCASRFTIAWSSSITSTRRWSCSPTPTSIRDPSAASYDAACRHVDRLGGPAARRRLGAGLCRHCAESARANAVSRRTSARASYEAAIEKAKEYIKAGDIFQVVLSQRLTTPTNGQAVQYLPDPAHRQSEPVHVLFANGSRSRFSGRDELGER